jgi:hypothetical protein
MTFAGDGNTVLKDIQQDCYAEMLVRLYTRARDRYLDACRLAGVETALSQRLREMDGFDPGTLLEVHDTVAAWFRFSQDDGGQMMLGEDAAAYRTGLEERWRAWFEEEVGRLLGEAEFVRAVLKATAEPASAARQWLQELLRERYRTMR